MLKISAPNRACPEVSEVRMKTIIRSLAVTLLAFFMLVTAFPVTASAEEAGFEPRLSSPSRSNAYYNRELNAYSQTGYGMPNCVAYAYGRIYEITGKKPKITHGSAGDWWFINKNNGYYEYGSEPELGAVACWSNHVAVVEKIEGSTVTASQSHWGGRYFDTTVFESGTNRFGQKFYGYIYMSRGYFEEIEREKEEEIRRAADELAQMVKDMETAPPQTDKAQPQPAQLFEQPQQILINSAMLKNAAASSDIIK